MPIILKVMELNEGLIIKNIIDIGNKKFVYQKLDRLLSVF